jgi:cytochrome b561
MWTYWSNNMQTDALLKQQSARKVDLTPLSHGNQNDGPAINVQRPPFDDLTIGLHWATVLLVLALFASAWLHALAELRHSDFTPIVLQIHRSLGVTVWVVTVLRLAWRLTNARLPPFPTQMTRLQQTAVKSSEYGLYALLLAQPMTGLLTTLLGGRPFALFLWRVPSLMPRDEMLRTALFSLHEFGAWVLGALVVGHAAVALFHHFVLRDDVLACMAPLIAPPRPEREPATERVASGRSTFGE